MDAEIFRHLTGIGLLQTRKIIKWQFVNAIIKLWAYLPSSNLRLRSPLPFATDGV